MKLSFSISSKTSSSSSRPTSTKPPQSFTHTSSESSNPQPQFVTVFDPSKALAPNIPIIPPIPNTTHARPLKKMKNLMPPPSLAPSETRFVLDTSDDPAAASAAPYGLTLRSRTGDPKDQDQDSLNAARSEPASDIRQFREYLRNTPDDRGMDEFAEVPIEGFAAAILAGYGWSEGKGIGRNNREDVKIVQSERRVMNHEGLGYVPAPDDPKVSRRKGRGLPIEEKKPDPGQVDQEKIVRALSERDNRKDEDRIRDTKREEKRSDERNWEDKRSDDRRRVDQEKIVRVVSEDEKSLKKGKDLGIHERDSRKDESRIRDKKREEKRSGDRNWEEKRSGEGKREEKRSEERKREDKRGRDEETKVTEKSSNSGRVQWIASHIKVRIVSRDFRRGKFYRQKGKVVDVVGRRTCMVMMDESGELVEDVDQEILETALPKRGGCVLVLYGKHKGVFGSLVERDMEEETGVVEDAGSRARVNVRLDQIAEYVGDPSDLGY